MQPSMSDPVRVLVIAAPMVAWGIERLLGTGRPSVSCVGTVSSVAEACSPASCFPADVVVLDLEGIDGSSAVTALHAAGFGSVLAVSGVDDSAMRDDVVLSGARGVLDKRDPPETLLKAVSMVHLGQMWLDRHATSRIFLELARQQKQTQTPETESEHARLQQLTPRERQTVEALVKHASLSGKVLAQRLRISEHTLRNHLTSVYAKLGVANRVDLYAFATRHGLGG